MKIAFIGADSTGKTTLIDEVVHACSHMNMKVLIIKNVARGVISKGFPLAKRATVESYANYINDQLKREREAEKEGFEILLSDRTILDTLVNCKVNNQATKNMIADYFFQMFYEVWYLEAKLYNLYVHCPIEFPLVEDGIREIDTQYRSLVEEKIKKVLEEYKVPYINLCGSVKTRLNLVLTAISKFVGSLGDSEVFPATTPAKSISENLRSVGSVA